MTFHSEKLLLVGLDAACWEYLDPLLSAGRLPTLQKLMNNGVWGNMQTTLPPVTPAAWSSIITGVNPGSHGIYDMLWHSPGTYDFTPISGQNRKGVPFWKILNQHGLRVGLVNVPFTYPPETVDGFVVTGFGTPNSASNFASPGSALEWIQDHFPDFAPNVAAELLKSGTPEQILAAEHRHERLQVQIAVELASQYEVNVLAINLMLLDHANHKMPDMAQVQEAICRSDADLEILLEGFQPDHILLISDHGSSRAQGNFLLHAWLRDQGYLVPAPRSGQEQSQALNWILMQWLQESKGWSGFPERAARRLLNQVIADPDSSFGKAAWRSIDAAIPFARDFWQYDGLIDYSRSQIYPASIYSGMLYLNLQGREPVGVLSIKDRAGLAAEIAAKLEEITLPKSDRPLFKKIYLSEEVYQGPFAKYAPDLVLDGYDSGWNIQTRAYTSSAETAQERYFVGDQGNHGWHSREGIYIFCGPGFAIGRSAVDSHVTDIPGTLLYLCGVPVPDHYEGRVLTVAMLPEFVHQHPVLHQSSGELDDSPFSDRGLLDEEAEELEAHLRALGYLE